MKLTSIFALLLLLPAAALGQYQATDLGGGGWLHSGAFHPTNPDILLVGTDATGGIFRSDDSGGSWIPWNQGLENDHMASSMYVEDLVGVELPGGTTAFFAATHGGLYRRTEYEQAWQWMVPLQPVGALPGDPDLMVHWWEGEAHREPTAFSCLDWNGSETLVAGAGKIRYGKSWENTYYPGAFTKTLKTGTPHASSQFNCNDERRPVWIYDLGAPEQGWYSLPSPDDDPATIGAVRDISIATVDGSDYIAVAGTEGPSLYDVETQQWHQLIHNNILDPEHAFASYPMYDLESWSIHLTERGTLYLAVARPDGTGAASGVYRIHDVVSNPNAIWEWVGSLQDLYLYDKSMWEVGRLPIRPDLIYMSVVDGTGIDTDLLYLGSRNHHYGLFLGAQPYTADPLSAGWATLVTDPPAQPLHPTGFDDGWIDFWGHEVLFHPMVTRDGYMVKLAVQFNGRLHISEDFGVTWEQCYVDGSEAGWTSRGYNEHSVRDVAFMNDGRGILAAADTGIAMSTDHTQSAWRHLLPTVSGNATPEDDRIKNPEAIRVEKRENWRGAGKEALFINFSDWVQKSSYGKIFFFRESFTPGGDPEWINITSSLSELDHYLFTDLVLSDDTTIFVAYQEYDGVVGSGSDVAEIGVLRGKYDICGMSGERGGDFVDYCWTWTKVGEPLAGATDGSWVNDLLYNEAGGTGRIYLANTRTKSSGGGLFMLSDLAGDTWETVIDGTDYSNNVMDFRTLAQSPDNERLYVGTRGHSSGTGAVLVCDDPANPHYAPGDPDHNWTFLANDPDDSGNRPFEFNSHLPFWSEDWGQTDPSVIDLNFTHVWSMAVHPTIPDILYVGLDNGGMSSRNGLWVCYVPTRTWAHVSPACEFLGMGIYSIGFNPSVPNQHLIGTSGQGAYVLGSSFPPLLQMQPVAEQTTDHAKTGNHIVASIGALGEARFRFSLPKTGETTLYIYDVNGRQVRSERGTYQTGEHEYLWDGRDDRDQRSAAGVYYVRLKSGTHEARGKFLLLR